MTNVSRVVNEYMEAHKLNDRSLAAEMTEALAGYPYPTERSISHTAIFYWRSGQTTRPDLHRLEYIARNDNARLAAFCRALMEAAQQDNLEPEPGNVVERESVSPLQDSTT